MRRNAIRLPVNKLHHSMCVKISTLPPISHFFAYLTSPYHIRYKQFIPPSTLTLPLHHTYQTPHPHPTRIPSPQPDRARAKPAASTSLYLQTYHPLHATAPTPTTPNPTSHNSYHGQRRRLHSQTPRARQRSLPPPLHRRTQRIPRRIPTPRLDPLRALLAPARHTRRLRCPGYALQ